MKKIILASALIIVGSLVGFAQSVDKALHNGKWYASAELGSNKITLSKTAATASVFDLQLLNETAMQYGKIAAADFVNDEGGQVKAGTRVENGYAYKVTGNVLWIGFQPKEWNYNVKALKNGDLLLEAITSTSTNKNTK